MQSILTKSRKEVMKRNAQSDKLWKVEKSDIETFEDAIAQLKGQADILKSEIFTAEGTYLAIAKDKKEKKLKNGKTDKYIEKCQSIIDGCKIKVEQKKSSIQSKIEKIEAEKKSYILEIDAKMQKLEAERKAIILETECKIEKLETDITYIETTSESTIKYHQGEIDNCYEEIPLVVSFPPSHHKKKEQLKEILLSIDGLNNSIQSIKIAEYNSNSKEIEHRLMIKKLQEESARADAEALRISQQQQQDEITRESVERKRIFEADKQRAKQRAIEREKEKEMGIIVERPYEP